MVVTHTPPPYHIDQYAAYLWGPNEEMVGDSNLDEAKIECPNESGVPMLRARGVGGKLPIRENMEFIALACNEHAKLRAALALAKDILDVVDAQTDRPWPSLHAAMDAVYAALNI